MVLAFVGFRYCGAAFANGRSCWRVRTRTRAVYLTSFTILLSRARQRRRQRQPTLPIPKSEVPSVRGDASITSNSSTTERDDYHQARRCRCNNIVATLRLVGGDVSATSLSRHRSKKRRKKEERRKRKVLMEGWRADRRELSALSFSSSILHHREEDRISAQKTLPVGYRRWGLGYPWWRHMMEMRLSPLVRLSHSRLYESANANGIANHSTEVPSYQFDTNRLCSVLLFSTLFNASQRG
ncbi:hypothetical protein SCHPADRAFT_570034 [Schizopora paradoxa]|uniref:Uncharacterized protein n=1 Tax=Schizopora paradoxa TaxID=27342 RepID=A0A0H2RC24_9AGAM|nr:hypothetical protein SCHPADRAFT_570034 [Schizopora paradoxa]